MRLAVRIGDGSRDVVGIAHGFLLSFRRLRLSCAIVLKLDHGGAKRPAMNGKNKWVERS
jgi:hypothetical protein